MSAPTLRTITPTIARRLAITKQHLADASPATMAQVARDLGCLQLDPINAVSHSHSLVMFSRIGPYPRAELDSLIYDQRVLFEYWAHEASFVLTEDYPIHAVRMRHYPTHTQWRGQVEAWLADAEIQRLRAEILERLRTEGPLPSRVFEQRSDNHVGSSGWTSGTDVNKLLDYLWQRGEIMVAKRVNNQRWWDVAERCLPEWTPRHELAPVEAGAVAAQKAIQALGVTRARQISLHYTRRRYPELETTLKRLQQEGVIQPVHIKPENGEGWGGEWFIHTSDLPLLDRLEAGEFHPRTTLLSPFDNLICDRQRTEQLFDFNYRMEIYVPQAKRTYGYYVLPILHGDRFIGRVDPLMDRRQNRLVINAVHAEPDAPDDAETSAAVADAIQSLATFLGAQTIDFSDRVPAQWSALRQAL